MAFHIDGIWERANSLEHMDFYCCCLWRYSRQTSEIQTKGLHFSPCELNKTEDRHHICLDHVIDNNKMSYICWSEVLFYHRDPFTWFVFLRICLFAFVVAYFAILIPMIYKLIHALKKYSFETKTKTRKKKHLTDMILFMQWNDANWEWRKKAARMLETIVIKVHMYKLSLFVSHICVH